MELQIVLFIIMTVLGVLLGTSFLLGLNAVVKQQRTRFVLAYGALTGFFWGAFVFAWMIHTP